MSSPKPSAPESSLNEFQQLLGLNNNVHYPPNQPRFCMVMHLQVRRQWDERYRQNRSQEFNRLAAEVLPEIHRTMDVGTNVTFTLVYVGKYKLSNKLKMIFVIASVVNFDPIRFGNIFNKIIKKNGAIGERLVCVQKSVKVQNIPSEDFEHLRTHGANPCPLCVKILKNHRGINVNNRSNLVDLLAFTNVLFGAGFFTTVAILLL